MAEQYYADKITVAFGYLICPLSKSYDGFKNI